MGVLSTIILFVAILGLLVFVHELGHFLAAKRAGVRVDEFGFGFPPRIFGKKFRGTLYSLNWIPLGGFVKIKGVAGDDPAPVASRDQDSFATKPFLTKFAILVAGICMNIATAAFLFAVAFTIGFSVPKHSVETGARTSDLQVVISHVIAESPAAEAKIQTGDEIIQYNDTNVTSIEAVQDFFSQHAGEFVQLQLQSAHDEPYTVTVAARTLSIDGQEYTGIGVGLEEVVHARYPWYQSLWLGVKVTGSMIWQIVLALSGIVKDFFTRGTITQDLSGPVGIAVMTGQVAELGVVYLIQFAALLSVNLGVFNLLPIPALDGGRIAFVVIEKIQRRPVSHRVEAVVHNVGFILLLALIVLVTWRDIVKL